MIETILIWAAVAGLIVTEGLGFIARRFGFITISETSRKNWKARLAVAVLIVVMFAWWLVHSAGR